MRAARCSGSASIVAAPSNMAVMGPNLTVTAPAYEPSSSISFSSAPGRQPTMDGTSWKYSHTSSREAATANSRVTFTVSTSLFHPCLLYTSDAADDLTRVDLG